MFKKLILHSGKFSMSNIWFNLRCLGKIKYRYMLGFLTHTWDNSFKTAPDFFLVLRKFVPKSSGSLSCELWAVAAASAGAVVLSSGRTVLFTGTERTQPRDRGGLGSNAKRERPCPTEQRNDREHFCSYTANVRRRRKGHLLCLGRAAGKDIPELCSGKVSKEPLLLCFGHLFLDVKWNSLKRT